MMESTDQETTGEYGAPTLISLRTALLLFSLLLAGAALFLKGNLRLVMVVVILGLIAKSFVHHLRSRVE